MAQTSNRIIMLRGMKDALVLGNQVSPLMLKGLVITSVLMGAIPVGMAWTSKQIIDSITHSGNRLMNPEWYLLAEALLAVIFLGSNKFDAIISIALRAKLGHCVREKIIAKVQGFSLNQMEDPSICDLITRTRKYSETRPLSILKKSSEIGHYLIATFFAGIILFQYAPVLLVAILLASIPVLIADMKFNGDLFDILLWKSPANRMKLYIESILTSEASAKEVRVLGFATLLMNRFRTLFYDQYQHEQKLTLRRSVWNVILSSIGQLVLYLAFGWSIYRAIHGEITIGEMTMLMLLLRQSQTSIVSLMSAVASLYDDCLYMCDFAELMHMKEEMPKSGVQQGRLPGDGIRLENVSYRYPKETRFALSGINLHIKPGASVAILGANGSGKSTLVKLIIGLYTPSYGRITLDGTSLEDWDRSALNRRLSAIFQDYQSYQMTVYDNVAFGDVTRMHEKETVSDCIDRAHASDIVSRLRFQENTQLGYWFDDGVSLSGGQWQRLALARAYMKVDADIFIFDEPTSAIDPVAEAEVYNSLLCYTHNKSVVFITHRYALARTAETIILLDEGKIAEQGSHDALMSEQGRYYNAFKQQAKNFAETLPATVTT